MTRHICCVRLTHWPIDRITRQGRRASALHEQEATKGLRDLGTEGEGRHSGASASSCLPFLLTRTTANRQLVVAISEEAEEFGIKPGMTLPEARSLCAHVRAIEHEPHRDAVALEALARWMLRFTPIVSIGDGSDGHSACLPGEKEPSARISRFCQGERLIFEGVAAHPRDQLRVRAVKQSASGAGQSALLLDLTGSQYVFGSYANIVRQIEQALRRFGLRAAIATGPTVGAAWAMTFCDTPQQIGPMASPAWQATLNELPPVALRIDDDTIAALHHLGITGIGLLRKLPRRELLARFGPLLLRRMNQALGLEEEVLVPVRPTEHIFSGVEFEFGVDSLELLWSTIQEHVDTVVRQLTRRGLGVRTLEFTLLLQDEPPLSQILNLSRPSRDAQRLFRLIRVATESFTSPASMESRRRATARRLFGARFSGVRLRVLDAMRIRDSQITLLESENVSTQEAISDLVERLSLRLNDRIVQASLVESHLPERAWKPRRGLSLGQPGEDPTASPSRTHPDARRPSPLPGEQQRIDKSRESPPVHPRAGRIEFNPRLRSAPEPAPPGEGPINPRPLRLIAPQEIHVMVSPSHDRDGRPVSYTTHEGVHRRILHARGPERIAGEWWRGHGKTRDYFDVEDDAHHRLWMFRVNDNGRWFVQGGF